MQTDVQPARGAASPLIAEGERERELIRMKRIATSLLVVAAIIFIGALRFEAAYPWVGFIRAAAEGAMVGALADWFAVTALFRRPLGLPIPHTAIIPARKDSIGISIGRFVQQNFLSAEVLTRRVRARSTSVQLGHWLAQPEVAERVARMLASGAGGALQVINDADVQAMIERAALNRIESTPMTPLAGRVLGAVLVEKRRRELLTAIVQLIAQLLEENQEAIKKRISAGLPWWLPRSIDQSIYIRLVETVTAVLKEISQDPGHPLHAQFDALIDRFVTRLQNDPELITTGEAYKSELIEHPMVRELAASLWQGAKASLVAQSERDDSELRAAFERGVIQLGNLLQRDTALAAKIDGWAEGAAGFAATEYGDEVGDLIAQTVSRWDAETTAHRIELQVGRDLQFIRINGTIVGGLAGLVIYGVSLVLK
jgi:uncharacterized membrane-anchored protein YjiN (DUF445 family)